MKSLQDIYDEAFEIDTHDSLRFEEFYKKYSLILENKSSFEDQRDFRNFIHVHTAYTFALESLGHNQQAITQAEKTQSLIEKYAQQVRLEPDRITGYWLNKLSSGRCNFNLGNYNLSIGLFKQLVHYDPESDIYRNWLRSARNKKRNSINKYLYFVGMVLILVSFVLLGTVEDHTFRKRINYVGIGLILLAVFNEYAVGKLMEWGNKT